MTRIAVTMLCILLLISCHKTKDLISDEKIYLKRIQKQLEDSLDVPLKGKIDYGGGILTKLNDDSLLLLRFPIVNTGIESKFVLVRIDNEGLMLEGRFIELQQLTNSGNNIPYRKNDDNPSANHSATVFNGTILIRYLNGTEMLQSTITNGYIDEWHNNKDFLSNKVQGDIDVTPNRPIVYKLLPEVIVTGSSGGGWGSSSNWYSMGSFLYGSSGGGINNINKGTSISAHYSHANGGTQTSSGSGESKNITKDNYVREDKSMLVDFELMPDSVIDVISYLKCFDLVPNNGAVCSIELFTDIPVDGKPNMAFNIKTGSPGHTFIQIVKKASGQIVSQNIGFYPSSKFKTLLTTAPIDGVFADNQNHEFNASIKMSITTEQLQTVIEKIGKTAKHPKYDIDDYNCTDFALEVFNSIRGNNILEIPRLDIPETMNPYGSNTPQGLYLKLEEMRNTGAVEANQITIPGLKGYVGKSHGACN